MLVDLFANVWQLFIYGDKYIEVRFNGSIEVFATTLRCDINKLAGLVVSPAGIQILGEELADGDIAEVVLKHTEAVQAMEQAGLTCVITSPLAMVFRLIEIFLWFRGEVSYYADQMLARIAELIHSRDRDVRSQVLDLFDLLFSVTIKTGDFGKV